MPFLAAQGLTGISSGATLFLVASGLTLIFGVTRVVNFAHGSLFMLGAYLAWTFLNHLPPTPLGFVVGVLGAALATALLGALMEIALLRPLYGAPELFQLLATFGVVLIVQDATLAIWGPADLPLPRPRWMRGSAVVAGERVPLYDLWLIAVAPVVLAMLWALLNRTRWGMLIRAATENRRMAAALGIDQRMLFTSAFTLGAGLAGLGGALVLPSGSANLQMDLTAVTNAFVVVVVGGLGSIAGAFAASMLIGVLQAFGIVLFPSVTLVLLFVVMAAALAVRPHGLLSRAGAPRTPDAEADRPAPVRAAGRLETLGGVALLAALAALPLVAGPYALSVATEAVVAVLFAASLHFVMGPGGMPSFGHAAWFGLGAYVAALAARDLGAPMLPAMAAALAAAGIAALAFGALFARRAGVTLAMLTLAFAQIGWAAASQFVSVTGGDNGLLGIWPDEWAAPPARFYWLALTICTGAVLMLRRALFAPFGYALRAARDAPGRALSIGIGTGRIRAAAFGIAGASAGLSGALFTFDHGSVFPGALEIGRSVDALLMVLLGGVATMSGPIAGGLVYTVLYDGLLRATDHWRLALGCAIIGLVLLFPGGLAGLVRGRVRG